LLDFSSQEFSAAVGKAATGHFIDEIIEAQQQPKTQSMKQPRGLRQEQKEEGRGTLDGVEERRDKMKCPSRTRY